MLSSFVVDLFWLEGREIYNIQRYQRKIAHIFTDSESRKGKVHKIKLDRHMLA